MPSTAGYDSATKTVGDSLLKVIQQPIDKLLLECLALAAIARGMDVPQRWLQISVNQQFSQTPKTIEVTPKNWDG